MKIEKININDLKPSEYNPRQISSDDMQKLKNSLSTFGLVDPIIVNLKNNHIIGGHQRYEALVSDAMLDNDFTQELNILKLGDVGWVFVDEKLEIKDSSHEKALNLALNKISGDWDESKLSSVFDELEITSLDIECTGFDELEIEELKFEEDIVYEETDFEDQDIDDLYEPVSVKKLVCPKCGHSDESNKFKTINS